MRGLLFLLAFAASLPFIFISPFNGVLAWYAFSLGNFHTLIWGSLGNLYYAWVISILTCIAWLCSRTDPKRLPLTPLVVLTLLFMLWMVITSLFALGSSDDVWHEWTRDNKMLFMCLVGYALTTTRERIDQLIWVVLLAIGVWGVKGAILGSLHGFSMIHGPDGGMNAPNNEFGVSLIMVLPLVFYQWQLATNRHLRRGLMVMGFLVGLAVILTYSRGALLGVSAMAAVLWLKSRAKIPAAFLILAVALFVYNFAPEQWFNRMNTIENYQGEGSAESRIWIWQVSLKIAEERPFFGGGFRVTHWPDAANSLLTGSSLKRMTSPMAAHSSYFDVLSEHGWVGLALFLMIGAYSWVNCSWLIRRSSGRPELAWANTLGKMGQAVLAGFWVGGAFQSLAYFDEYWGLLFIFDAARRVVAREITMPVGAFVSPMRLRAPALGVGVAALAGPAEHSSQSKSRS
jgi:probable O-glycosylation ligase (exosortase A-associated)